MARTATEVLDTYADVIRRLRQPAGYMASFMAFQMTRDLRRGDKRGQFYPVVPDDLTKEVSEADGAEFASYLGLGLVGAPVYQVTGEMCDAIEAMFPRTVAEATPVIHEATLPGPAGFAWLDKPLGLEVEDGIVVPVHAISWAAHNATTTTGTIRVLRFTTWLLVADDVTDDNRPLTADEIADTERMLGALSMHHTDTWLLDKPAGDAPKTTGTLLAYTHMLWMMLQMEITAVERAPGTRGARRRAERYTGPTDVYVITLRRARHRDHTEDAPAGEGREVDWSCRWLVQPHYRHDVAPSRDTWHHAVPTANKRRCVVCGAEVTYIGPYVKGPDGKPLKIRRVLNRLAR